MRQILLQNVTAILLQNATGTYYLIRNFLLTTHYIMRILLLITFFSPKVHRYYKMRRLLQNASIQLVFDFA